MPSRDPLELRKHVATVPSDLNDPPRFSQMVETVKDALVYELRTFLNQSGFTTDRRTELPTVEKYAIGFGSGLDPYQTFVKIVEMFPDVTERFPHIAVTTAAGSNRRMTTGRPFIAHTQAPPRVVTANAGPYALSSPAAQIVQLAIGALPPATYTVVVDSVVFETTILSGNIAETAAALALFLRQTVLGELFRITATTGPTAAVLLENRTVGSSSTVTTSANLVVSTLQAASIVTTSDVLAFRTWPGNKGSPVTSVIQFAASRFATTEPLAAVPASAIARVFNEQALYAYARPVSVGVGTGVQFETGGKLGPRTPNEIEILSSSTPSLVAALGLGASGTAGAGASIGGVAPIMTVTVAGTPFTSAMIGRYFVLDGATSEANDGRFLILDVPTSSSLEISNVDGIAEALPPTAPWFIGLRDDSRNSARPVMNRYHMAAELSITIDILGESPNLRTEIFDLVFSEFIFFLEQKHFTLYGRGIFEPDAYPDEHYQITIHQEVSDGGESDFPRGEDQKDRVHVARLVVPVTVVWYVDRSVLVPSGPSAGESWTLESENISPDDTLPSSS